MGLNLQHTYFAHEPIFGLEMGSADRVQLEMSMRGQAGPGGEHVQMKCKLFYQALICHQKLSFPTGIGQLTDFFLWMTFFLRISSLLLL